MSATPAPQVATIAQVPDEDEISGPSGFSFVHEEQEMASDSQGAGVSAFDFLPSGAIDEELREPQAGADADSELSASQLRHRHQQAADVGGVGTWAPVRLPPAPTASQPAQPPQPQGTATDASSLFDLGGLEIKAQPVSTPALTGQPCV